MQYRQTVLTTDCQRNISLHFLATPQACLVVDSSGEELKGELLGMGLRFDVRDNKKSLIEYINRQYTQIALTTDFQYSISLYLFATPQASLAVDSGCSC
jgi:hypothetical protein